MTIGTLSKSVRRILVLTFCLIIIGCSQNRLQPETIRICDASGCSDRPGNYSSFVPPVKDWQDDLDKNIPALEELAHKDPRAAYDLGLRFFRGDGVRKDSYQALQWMRNAAERGDFYAQKALGRLYLTGLEEMGSDPREAQKWLTLAAGRGDKESEKLLEEAIIARKNEESYSIWTNRWRSTFYGYWYSGYPYRYHWRRNRWHYNYY